MVSERHVPDNKNEPATEDISGLIEKAVHGDSNAFGRLYDMHVDRVYRHIYYRVTNVADAEDLTQKVFLKAWKGMSKYKKTTSPFPAWLMTISHNVIIDFYRSRKPEFHGDFDITSPPEADPARMVETRNSEEEIKKYIRLLGNDQQQVILFRFIEDMSFAEIGAAMGKSEGAIRVILHRGLSKLKNIMEQATTWKE